MGLSFPYPKIGKVTRPAGQGCQSCQHGTYCPALYWMRRGAFSNGERQQPIDDRFIGRACESWSDDPADKINPQPTEDDLVEAERIEDLHIGSEANRSGLTDLVTATFRRP